MDRRSAGPLFAAVVLLATGISSAGAAPGEDVFFEHFAAPAGGLPPGWTGTGQVVTDRGHGPPGALSVVDDSTTEMAGASTLVPVTGETTYDLSLYTFTNAAGDGGRIRVVVEQFATASGALGTLYGVRVLDVPVSSSWRQNLVNFTTANRARRIRIGLYPAHGGVTYTGRAWFDELRVSTAAAATSPVLDASGAPVPVTRTENLAVAMSADQFWSRLPEVAADPAVSSRSLWSYDLLRRHYLVTNLAVPRVADALYRDLPTRARTTGVRAQAKCLPDGEQREPVATDPDPPCAEGFTQVVPTADRRVFAADVAYQPIVSPHPYPSGTYTTEYFPRRTHDYLQQLGTADDTSLLPAMVLTGNDPRFADLADRLLAFTAYSQYTSGGDNPFVREEYPAAFADLSNRGLTQLWRGGWPSVFNWSWLDGQGYIWQPYEPDHHVNAEMANAMVRAYEVTGRREPLDAATAFVREQVPRYGWHTGVWSGKRYYWTEYSPTGVGNAHLDAVDNVQALVARAAAMVGYHTGDRRMLEYARGLLWYCLREFTTDGRWYYEGGENPMNQRRAVSHDMAVLLALLGTVPYLLKAGVPLDTELPVLTAAYDYYRGTFTDAEGRVPAPFHRLRDGQPVKLAPRWLPDSGTWEVTSYFTANRTGGALVVADALPNFTAPPLLSTVDVTVRRLLPPQREGADWTVDPGADLHFIATPGGLRAGIPTDIDLRPGDVIRVSYQVRTSAESWTSVPSATFSFRTGDETVTVRSIVPTAAFPTIVTADNYPTIAAKLAFPAGAD